MTPERPSNPPVPMARRESARRTLGRIALETSCVALAGATVWGVLWEVGLAEEGWIAAVVIWVAGAPVLEIIRLFGR